VLDRWVEDEEINPTRYGLKPCTERRRQLGCPCLEAMRLRRCCTELATLQDMISAGPRLADVRRLESLSFVDNEYLYMLRCEAATFVAIADCCRLQDNFHHGKCRVKLAAPRLHHFRYTHVGFLNEYTSFYFDDWRSWTTLPNLEHMHIHLEVHSGSEDAAHLRRSVLTHVS
jgi:hypothetical protein